MYRVLRDVTQIAPGTTLHGHDLACPILIAPMAFQKLAHPDGELATAEAARRNGTIMILSTLANTPMEQVVARAPGSVWFQLYIYKDRQLTAGLVRRAEAAGCRAIVLTVDAPVLARREKDIRNTFRLPEGFMAENILPPDYEPENPGSGLSAYFESLLDPGLTWEDLAWLRSLTPLPILVKGIVHPEDARLALEHGAAAIVVSNHGGRQLDTAPATIEALPRIANRLAGLPDAIPLLVDGGIRRGTDVIKALACGARAVLLGRPILWGLTLEGADGAARVLTTLVREFTTAMALCGCRSIEEISSDLIW